ncbi:NADP-dependent 3-hydroxy acid dehydrogenase YdfG [Actinocorallia herbida]|uniref:NADP-dependent 3-hydroxy acid dehydrogenase YdfG n=1 Tax=Actinocorallia herbida TaxID=58109 RepID=A0A3N1D2K7_9ACTN|nr:oxidoreductase [Actinocorallia herbida]ROO87742.1 NADP-dependent 3-hydroxy acid dehydrogenase YdfG [Actinocorallia herbida]
MSRTWLITGASRGFGRALAEAVLAAGDRLVATARRPERLADLASAYGDRVLPTALDVTDASAARHAVRSAVACFGRLDVVVNNAGYANSGPIEEMAEDDFRAQFEANFFGVVNVTRAALPVLRRQRSGMFVQFSSLGGRVGGTPGMGAYQSAKFAVEGFSEVLAGEVAPFGVKVLIVEPGAFRTDWQGSSMELHPVGPDYEETVGAMNRYRAQNNGAQPGDPVRAAEILIDAVNDDAPPRRLLLGAAAVTAALEAGEARAAETRKWALISAAADFPA